MTGPSSSAGVSLFSGVEDAAGSALGSEAGSALGSEAGSAECSAAGAGLAVGSALGSGGRMLSGRCRISSRLGTWLGCAFFVLISKGVFLDFA